MNAKRVFKRLHVKMLISIKKGLKHKELPLTEEEEICFEIFKKQLYSWNSRLLMSPKLTEQSIGNSNLRFIHVGDMNDPEMAIILSYPTIKVVNHVYCYPIDVNKQLYLRMIDMFDRKITKERNIMVEAIEKNIKNGLKNLI